MGVIALAAFAFLVGVTISGLSGSAMEIVGNRRLGFVEPYVSSRRIGRSLLATLAAGPMMLVNDALTALGEGRVGPATVAVTAVLAFFWACATGVVVTEVALMMGRPLG